MAQSMEFWEGKVGLSVMVGGKITKMIVLHIGLDTSKKLLFERQKDCLSFVLLSKWLQQLGWGQAGTRSRELILGLSCVAGT